MSLAWFLDPMWCKQWPGLGRSESIRPTYFLSIPVWAGELSALERKCRYEYIQRRMWTGRRNTELADRLYFTHVPECIIAIKPSTLVLIPTFRIYDWIPVHALSWRPDTFHIAGTLRGESVVQWRILLFNCWTHTGADEVPAISLPSHYDLRCHNSKIF